MEKISTLANKFVIYKYFLPTNIFSAVFSLYYVYLPILSLTHFQIDFGSKNFAGNSPYLIYFVHKQKIHNTPL